MQTVYPMFYKEFACIAGECKHSCCRGWEIDIDKSTADKYMGMKGNLGDEIRANVSYENGVHSFILTEDEKCPFLQENGLCKLILSAGEEILCDICANHPRFFTVFNDYELAGVGLSCEVSCNLLLGDAPLSFYVEGISELLNFSDLLDLLNINIPSQQQDFYPGLSIDDAMEVLDIMDSTEPIDDRWKMDIACFREYAQNTPDFLEKYSKSMPAKSFKKMYQYIMYRQLEKLSEYSLEDLLIYTDISVEYIFIAAAIRGDLGEALRRWSEQIEYCPENVAMLLKM